jgi:hypothetical protein
MSNPIEDQIKARIQAFVGELDLLVRKSTLEALRDVLGGAPAVRRGPGRRPGPGRPRTADVAGLGDAIVAHVKANDGQTVGEISKALSAAPKEAKKVIARLIASGALKKTGQKRGTRYHAGSGVPARSKRGKRPGRKA